MELHEISPTKD